MGTCKVGDTQNGYTIVSFGKAWQKNIAGNEHFKGQLWEPCHCGKEPVYLPHDLCETCINNGYGQEREVCYAYIEPTQIDESAE